MAVPIESSANLAFCFLIQFVISKGGNENTVACLQKVDIAPGFVY